MPLVSVWSLGGNQGEESVNQLWAVIPSPSQQSNSAFCTTYAVHSLKRPPQPWDQPLPINRLVSSPFAPSPSTSSSAATLDSSNFAYTIDVLPDLASKISQTAILPSIAKTPGDGQLPIFASQSSLSDRPVLSEKSTSHSVLSGFKYYDIIAAPRAKQGVTSLEAKQVAYEAGKAPRPAAVVQGKAPSIVISGVNHVAENATETNAGISTTSKTLATHLEFLPVPPDHEGAHPGEFFIRVVPPPFDYTWLSVEAGSEYRSEPPIDLFLGLKSTGSDSPGIFHDGNAVYAASLQTRIDQIRASLLEGKTNNLHLPNVEEQECDRVSGILKEWKWRLERAEGWEGVLDRGGNGGRSPHLVRFNRLLQ